MPLRSCKKASASTTLPRLSSIGWDVRISERMFCAARPANRKVTCGGRHATSHRNNGIRAAGIAGFGSSQNSALQFCQPRRPFLGELRSHPVLSAPVTIDPLKPVVCSVRWTGQMARSASPSMTLRARVTGSSNLVLVGRKLISPPVKLPPQTGRRIDR